MVEERPATAPDCIALSRAWRIGSCGAPLFQFTKLWSSGPPAGRCEKLRLSRFVPEGTIAANRKNILAMRPGRLAMQRGRVAPIRPARLRAPICTWRPALRPEVLSYMQMPVFHAHTNTAHPLL